MAAEPSEEAGLRETKRKRTKPRPKVVQRTIMTLYRAHHTARSAALPASVLRDF